MNNPTPPLDWTPPAVDLDLIFHWLTLAAWTSAALSVVDALLGLVMLAFGSPKGPGAVIGGTTGTIVAVVIVTTALPYLRGTLT